MKRIDKIVDYLIDEIEVLQKIDISKIDEVISIIDDCLKNGKRVYVMGNGGSASTASHMANDFNKALFEYNNNVFNFICLNDNMPTMLAIANDNGYDEVFRYQLEGRLNKNDVVIALSGSGNSKNIINAVEYANEVGAMVIGFTGYDGGMLKKLSYISIDSNINNMQITEDVHLMLEHLMISIFKDMYGVREYKTKKLINKE